MSGFYTEADYENSIIELFQNMGYRHVYAPDLERDFRSPGISVAQAESEIAGGCYYGRAVQVEEF